MTGFFAAGAMIAGEPPPPGGTSYVQSRFGSGTSLASVASGSMAGIAGGNTLVLVVTTYDDTGSGTRNMEPSSISAPAGSSWTKVVDAQAVAWGGSYPCGVFMYVAPNVAGGSEDISVGWSGGNLLVGQVALFELEGAVALDTHGAVTNNDNTPAQFYTATTAANPAAGDGVAIAVCLLNPGADTPVPVTADSAYTTVSGLTYTFAAQHLAYRERAYSGSTAETWTTGAEHSDTSSGDVTVVAVFN